MDAGGARHNAAQNRVAGGEGHVGDVRAMVMRASCSQRSATCLAFRTKSPGEVWPISASARSSTVPSDTPRAQAAMHRGEVAVGLFEVATPGSALRPREWWRDDRDLANRSFDADAPVLAQSIVVDSLLLGRHVLARR